MFSSRTNWKAELNSLELAVRNPRSVLRHDLIDLTTSNPTQVGIPYPDQALAQIAGRAAANPYEASSAGLQAARESLAAALSSPTDMVNPDDLVLTASTSEAYSWLFKLLCNASDPIVTLAPGYPLLEHLSELESVRLRKARLEFERHTNGGGRWTLTHSSLADASLEGVRAVAVVHPNNPTGSYLRGDEAAILRTFCIERGIPLISDEVFRDFPLREQPPAPSMALTDSGITFTLGGLSKSAGLPHWKLGWIRVNGEPALKSRVLAGLELIADTYLSVSGIVQRALPDLLPVGEGIRTLIRARCMTNLSTLRSAFDDVEGCELIEPDAGWSAVIRVPQLTDDESLAIELLKQCAVRVHPGYFFEFEREGHIVVSLLPEVESFAEATSRIALHFREKSSDSRSGR